jgi:hypothetical protein
MNRSGVSKIYWITMLTNSYRYLMTLRLRSQRKSIIRKIERVRQLTREMLDALRD